MNTDLNAYVPDVIFEKIPIKNLVSCQDYQRSLSESQILKIAHEFDLHQINPVKVSRRDGINYVFDGQHTIEAVALVSNSRDTPVWCMIYDHLCYEHEAHIFAEQQKHHRSVIWNLVRKRSVMERFVRSPHWRIYSIPMDTMFLIKCCAYWSARGKGKCIRCQAIRLMQWHV